MTIAQIERALAQAKHDLSERPQYYQDLMNAHPNLFASHLAAALHCEIERLNGRKPPTLPKLEDEDGAKPKGRRRHATHRKMPSLWE